MITNPHFLRRGTRLYTRIPPHDTRTERVIINTKAYAPWKAEQSKLAAGLLKGLRISLPETARILYLGAASGTTVGHLARLTPNGSILAIEFARIPYAYLLTLSKTYETIIPLLEDARIPEAYAHYAFHFTHIIQDIAQPDQVAILHRNARLYATPDTTIILAVKAKSIDATKPARSVYARVENDLRKAFTIHWKSTLEPYEKEHMLYKLSLIQ